MSLVLASDTALVRYRVDSLCACTTRAHGNECAYIDPSTDLDGGAEPDGHSNTDGYIYI